MNTKRTLISLLILSSVALAPGMAMADPIGVSTYVGCPGTQLGSYQLTNFGNYIAGFGYQSLLSQTTYVYFKSATSTSSVPASLTNYVTPHVIPSEARDLPAVAEVFEKHMALGF